MAPKRHFLAPNDIFWCAPHKHLFSGVKWDPPERAEKKPFRQAIFEVCPIKKPPEANAMIICMRGHFHHITGPCNFGRYAENVNNCNGRYWLTSSGVAQHGKFALPIHFVHGPYNTASTTVEACDKLKERTQVMVRVYFTSSWRRHYLPVPKQTL